MSLQDFQRSRVVFGDGFGRIFTAKGDGSNLVQFPHTGWDPSFCWGGNAIIWVDYGRKWVWVAALDGSGGYGVGVTANYMARPQLSASNQWYCLNSINPASGLWESYVCGGGGSGLARIVWNCLSPGVISEDGSHIYITVPGYRIARVNIYTGLLTTIPYNAPAGFPHVSNPAIKGSMLAFMMGDFTGLNFNLPATYKPSDIGVSNLIDGNVTRLNTNPGTPGVLVTNPSWWGNPAMGIMYDFAAPGGCGIWGLSVPGMSVGGCPVYPNPNGAQNQFRDIGANRVTA